MITQSKEQAHRLAEQGSLLAPLNASEKVVVCLVFVVFPGRATPPNASKYQLDQVISPKVVDLTPFTTPVPMTPLPFSLGRK